MRLSALLLLAACTQKPLAIGTGAAPTATLSLSSPTVRSDQSVSVSWASSVDAEYVVSYKAAAGTAQIVARGSATANVDNKQDFTGAVLPLGALSFTVQVITKGGLTSRASQALTVSQAQPSATFSHSLPTSTSRFHGSHDLSKRTIPFSTDATSVECSHDDGATFAACDTPTSIVFTPADYAQGRTLQLRGTKPNAPDAIHKIVPKTELPGLTFFTCTDNVTADESFTAFNLRLSAANAVVCLAPNVTVSSASGGQSIVLGQNGLRILGVEGQRAKFISVVAQAYAFAGQASITGPGPDSDASLVLAHVFASTDQGAVFDTANAGGHMVLSDVYLRPTNYTYGVMMWDSTPQASLEIQDSEIDGTNLTNAGIYLAGGSHSSVSLTVSNTVINVTAGPAFVQYTGTTSITGSTFTRTTTDSYNAGEDPKGAVQITSGASTITRTTIKGSEVALSMRSYACGKGFNNCSGAVWLAILDSVKLETGRDGVQFENTVSPTPLLTVTALDIKRVVSGSGAGSALNVVGGTPTVNSLTQTDSFCRVNASEPFTMTNVAVNGSLMNPPTPIPPLPPIPPPTIVLCP